MATILEFPHSLHPRRPSSRARRSGARPSAEVVEFPGSAGQSVMATERRGTLRPSGGVERDRLQLIE